MRSFTIMLTSADRVQGPPLQYPTRLACTLFLVTSDDHKEGAQEAQHLPKRAKMSTRAKAPCPWPVSAVALSRPPKHEAKSEAQQQAPIAATCFDATAQTEDGSRELPCLISWWDSEAGQHQLIRNLVRRGIAIPPIPLVAGDDPKPVLRVAKISSRRRAKCQP